MQFYADSDLWFTSLGLIYGILHFDTNSTPKSIHFVGNKKRQLLSL